MQQLAKYAALVLVGTILGSCNQEQLLPTFAPTMAISTPVPTLTSRPSPTPNPTATVPTVTPSATPVVGEIRPTSVVGSGVNITSPIDGETLLQGQQVQVSGLAQIIEGDILSVTLRSASGSALAMGEVTTKSFNSWIATIDVPDSMSGNAALEATVSDSSGNVVALDVVQVTLTPDTEDNEQYLELYRPTTGSVAVAGYHLFFDGIASLPVDNVVTISARNESCQNEIARQSYRLRGSGYWQGFLPLPVDVAGPICAIAHFGTEGEDGWREVQIPLNVLPKGDERGDSILIGNPSPGSSINPGQRLLFYGTAFNIPDNQILVSVLLENGRLLAENMTIVDYFGYWEIEFHIPANASGPASIEASYGERGSDEYISQVIAVSIGVSD